MSDGPVECSRCQETFATQDELVVHSIESHVDDGAGEPGTVAGTPADRGAGEPALDEQTLEQLRRVIDKQAPGDAPLQALYGQRFMVAVVATIMAMVLVLTGLHAIGFVPTVVFTFALGTLFGLTLAYMHAFVQSIE